MRDSPNFFSNRQKDKYVLLLCISVATVEGDLRYMQQPSRMYLGEGVNVFQRGSLVMEHPGASPSPIIGKPILYGGVHGTIGV